MDFPGQCIPFGAHQINAVAEHFPLQFPLFLLFGDQLAGFHPLGKRFFCPVQFLCNHRTHEAGQRYGS